MTRAACVLILCLVTLPAVAQDMPFGWGPAGLDAIPGFKYLHFLAGLSLGLGAAELAESLSSGPGMSPWVVPLSAIATAAIAGAGKEILDSTGFGDPRFSDFLVTTVGGVAAAAMFAYAGSLYPPVPGGGPNLAAFALSTAVLLALPVTAGAVMEVTRWLERRKALSSPGARASPAG